MENVDGRRSFNVSCAEQAALQRLTERALLSSGDSKEPMHFMVAGCQVKEPECSDKDLAAVRALAKRLAVEVAPELDIISVRILISPPGACAQPWHLDFAKHFSEVRTALLSVSRSTSANATELLDLGSPVANEALACRARAAGEPLRPEDWQDLRENATVQPLESAPWELTVLRTSHQLHRRGPNRSDFVRVAFNVDLARLADAPDFVDVDYARSLQKNRIAIAAEIDELDEQDASLAAFRMPSDLKQVLQFAHYNAEGRKNTVLVGCPNAFKSML